MSPPEKLLMLSIEVAAVSTRNLRDLPWTDTAMTGRRSHLSMGISSATVRVNPNSTNAAENRNREVCFPNIRRLYATVGLAAFPAAMVTGDWLPGKQKTVKGKLSVLEFTLYS
jgi:hypothetical protein